MKYSFYLIALLLLAAVKSFAQADNEKKTPESTEFWDPQPRVVTPGNTPGAPPSDAIILFDGKNLNNWISQDGSPAKWNVTDGAVTVLPKSGDIKTKQEFGNIQLHIEWRTPPVTDTSKVSQARGNSGIFIQDRYELQVLDNYQNKTYSNGQASSIYKQHIPLVNACRKPQEWQTYDVVYIAPSFNKEGRVITPAYITVFHNGVLTLNHAAIQGPTTYIGLTPYSQHGNAPIRLQDHGNLVSYRNIWVREL